MTVVADASAVVATLIDSGRDGQWARATFKNETLAAPHIMLAEAANTLRRSVIAGLISPDAATLAHAGLALLPVELFPYRPFSGRIWQLRHTLTVYDAWYVALAEVLGARLVTLDRRLARAQGSACAFDIPPAITGP